LVRNLNRFGAQVEELADGLRISGGKRVQGCLCDSFGDHRMAMALVILGSLVPGETVIQGPECVTVSFPEFFEIWQKVVY
jgi:3-phosphoshikimate 1-carboxyvinyltransferase